MHESIYTDKVYHHTARCEICSCRCHMSCNKWRRIRELQQDRGGAFYEMEYKWVTRAKNPVTVRSLNDS